MLPGLGWSASDIVLAVKVITKVCIAFRDAGGAKEQYASTAAFLDAFARTLNRINTYTESISLATDGKELSEDMASQMKLVYSEYEKFDLYLRKVEPGLSSVSFASRIVARAKWAIKEINLKVETLKKSVVTPMMFVTPLLAVETLSELRDIKSRLPDAALQEDSLRENRIMIIKINDDLAHLKDNLESYWWTRRWAMSSVEDDVKSLALAVKNNSDIVSNKMDGAQDQMTQARQEQAAANLTTLSTVETVMDSRLAYVESRIDILISAYRSKTGKEDQELHAMKKRVATSRQHLHQAASSARKALKHFGLLVMAVNTMHSNPVTKWILPLAGGIVGYDKIFEHGEKMVKSAGQTVSSSGKYIEDSGMLKNLKSWNPFTAAISAEKSRMESTEKSVVAAKESPPTSSTFPRGPGVDSGITKPNNLLDDRFGDFESILSVSSARRGSGPNSGTDVRSLSGTTLRHLPLDKPTINSLLDEPIISEPAMPTLSRPDAKDLQPQISIAGLNYVDDNPWA